MRTLSSAVLVPSFKPAQLLSPLQNTQLYWDPAAGNNCRHIFLEFQIPHPSSLRLPIQTLLFQKLSLGAVFVLTATVPLDPTNHLMPPSLIRWTASVRGATRHEKSLLTCWSDPCVMHTQHHPPYQWMDTRSRSTSLTIRWTTSFPNTKVTMNKPVSV